MSKRVHAWAHRIVGVVMIAVFNLMIFGPTLKAAIGIVVLFLALLSFYVRAVDTSVECAERWIREGGPNMTDSLTPLVERLARTAYEAAVPESLDELSSMGQPWDGLSEMNKFRVRDAVRAVLTEIREPSGGMMKAGAGAALETGEFELGEVWFHPALWQAMIDSVLAEDSE